MRASLNGTFACVDGAPLVVAIASSLHSATGATARVLAQHSTAYRVALVTYRDVVHRPGAFAHLLESAALIHWQTNLSPFPEQLQVARRVKGDVPQIAVIHHIEPHEEDKAGVLEGLVDYVQVPSRQTAAVVNQLMPDIEVKRAPYLVEPARRRRSRPGRRGDGLVVGWSGWSLDPDDRKRLKFLVRALADVRRRFDGTRLVIQGRVPDAILELARECHLPVEARRWVRWNGRHRFFENIDIYASTSSIEGGPLPVFEAAVAGTPVATTRVGMAADLLELGGALELPVDDVNGQAEVLAHLASLSLEARFKLARHHRVCALEVAGPARAEDYERLWLEVGRQPATGPWTAAAVSRHNEAVLQRDHLREVYELVRAGHRLEGALASGAVRPWRLPAGEGRAAAREWLKSWFGRT